MLLMTYFLGFCSSHFRYVVRKSKCYNTALIKVPGYTRRGVMWDLAKTRTTAYIYKLTR